MKTLVLFLLGLFLCSVAMFGGEYLMNDTGHTAYGLHVVFSEAVKITAFGDTLTSIAPSWESTEFTFSAGKVDAWGGQWLNWKPASAVIVEHQWYSGTSADSLSVAISMILNSDSPFGSNPEVPEKIRGMVYSFLSEPRDCRGHGSFTMPVYVSIPIATPDEYAFSLNVEDTYTVDLTRIDEADLVGSITVIAIPAILHLQLFVNGDPVGESFQIHVENGYQAITLAVHDLPGIESRAPFPLSFHRGACVTDVWGDYLYGAHGEWGTVHTRNYFEPTCIRLAEDGVKDVYVTSFIEYVTIKPLPKMRLFGEGGAGGISEDDLRMLVEIAHRYGLRLHLMYNAYSVKQDYYMSWLWRAYKSETWIRTLLDEYKAVIVAEARKAEACGVDYFMLNWQHGAVTYHGNEALWAESWRGIINSVKQVYSGKLQYNLPMWGDIDDIVTDAVPLSTFDGIDSFLYSQWNPNFHSYSDSLPAVYQAFRKMLSRLQPFADLVLQPLYLEVAFQSTDGYLVDGWHDVAIGLVGNTQPDFFEQARLYEGLLQAISNSDVIDGIVSYKYHWDDPFGPDLAMEALARMDLSASVRDKPAEAILKRWFGGTPSPTSSPDEEGLAKMNRPWCRSCSYEVPYQGSGMNSSCAFVVDDFQSPALRSALGGVYDYDSNEKHHPNSSSSSSCLIARAEDKVGNGYLAASYSHNAWLKIRLTNFGEFDASQYEGIQLTLWADHHTVADLELGTISAGGEWRAYGLSGLPLRETPKTFRIPFSDLGLQSDGSTNTLIEDLQRLVAIGIFPGKGQGTIYVDDICFY